MTDESKDTIFVGGEFVPAHGTARYQVVNPATEEVMGSVPLADAQDVATAAESAYRAGRDPAWRDLTATDRAVLLDRIADLLEDHGDQFADLLTRQNGLPIGTSRVSIGKTCAAYRYYASLARELEVERIRPSSGAHAILRREPIGVAALIVPWNGPQSLLSWKLAPALAAGATAVVKPALETSLDAYLLMELINEAGIPPGVVNLVTGDGDTGALLVDHPSVRTVAFTGSTRAGRDIATRCAQRLIPANLELGGKSAAILLDDAPLESFAPLVVGVCSPNTGQVCRACTRVLVPADRYNDAVEMIAGVMSAIPIGDPMSSNTVFGPVVSGRQRDRIEDYIRIGLAEGATLATGGGRPPEFDRGYYVQPTVFRDVDNSMRIAREEIFGPVIAVLPYRDLDDAIAIANDSDFGLGGFVHTTDPARGTEVARRIETGSIGVNFPGMILEAPFGGYKQSGLGKELGPEGLEAFLTTKTIYRPGDAPS